MPSYININIQNIMIVEDGPPKPPSPLDNPVKISSLDDDSIKAIVDPPKPPPSKTIILESSIDFRER